MKDFFKKHGVHLWMGACFLLLAFVTYYRIFIQHLINADMSSEMVLSQLLHEEGRLLSSHWFYSTELRVFNAHLLITPLLSFLRDWRIVRFVVSLLLYTSLLFSYLFMSKRFGLGRLTPFFAGCLLLPLSGEYFYYVLYGLFYAPYMILTFLILGGIAPQLKGEKRSIASLILLLLLSFVSGLNGLRQMLTLQLPLLCAAAFLLYHKASNTKITLQRNDFLPGLSALLLVLSAGFGYVINAFVFTRVYAFRSFGTMTFIPFSFERLQTVFQGLLTALGFVSGGQVFGGDLLINASALLLFFLFLFALYRLHRHFHALSSPKQLLLVYFDCALLLFALLYAFTDMEYAVRYAFPFLVLLFPLLQIFLEDCLHIHVLRRLFLLGLLFAMGLSTLMLYKVELSRNYDTDCYDFSVACVSEGYTQGYATFWNANLLIEYTSGTLDVWVMQTRESTSPTDLVKTQQRTAHITDTPQGKVFIFLTQDEADTYTFIQAVPASFVFFETNRYIGYGFDSYDQMMQVLTQ